MRLDWEDMLPLTAEQQRNIDLWLQEMYSSEIVGDKHGTEKGMDSRNPVI